ncbi:MAG: 8-amino-7-oxononanoate synthase [Candidatus Acidiferrum sp.]
MPSDFHASFLKRLGAGLRQLADRDQLRSLAEVPGVNLYSNDYLGLAEHPALKRAVEIAVDQAPRVGGTGSRLLSGHAAIWDDLEQEFANFAGTQAALYFGSGYAANLGLLASIAGKDDLIFSDALNHASIIDGIRLSGARKVIYPHLDLNALESALREHQNERCQKFVVTETVFSMDGDIAPVADLLHLTDRYGAGLIVDEAHATAVHGPTGRGIAAQATVIPGLVASVHTCGKALASAGAFVCGSSLLKDHLVNHARTFIFSTALPPYMAAQVRAALHLSTTMDDRRDALHSRAQHLTAALRAAGWDTAGSTTQIIPVVIGDNRAALSAAGFLQQQGFAARAIRPPTVAEGRARLRFSLTYAIDERRLAHLPEVLDTWRALECRTAAMGRA